MAVGPQGVAAGGSPRRVEQALLGDEHERPVGMLAAPDRRLPRGDLRRRAPDVHRRRPGDVVVGPRHRRGQRVVHLEHAGSVAEPLEAPPVAVRETIAGERDELPRRHVGEHHPRGRQRVERVDAMVTDHLTAVGGEDRDQRVGDRLRAPGGERPADQMPEGPQGDPERRRQRPVEREDRMGRDTGEEGGRRVAGEPAGHTGRAAQPGQPEPGHRHRMARHRQRREQPVDERQAGPLERGHQSLPGAPVGSQPGRRLVHRAVQDRRTGRQRVGERHVRLHPPHAVLLERQGAQCRGCHAERVDRRAHVVTEAGLGQLGGAAPASRRRCRLEHDDLVAGLGERDRADEAVGS